MKTRESIATSALCTLITVLLAPGVTRAQAANPIPYKLNAGSTYQTGCFPPCDCPLSQEFDLNGTFTLTCADDLASGQLTKYAVRDIEWTASLPDSSDPPVSVAGVGTHMVIRIGPLPMEEMRLRLVFNDASVRRLEFTPAGSIGSPFPDIRTTVTSNDMSCQDTVIVLDASPLGACCPNGPDDPACLMATEAECAAQGGTYEGNGSTCPTEPGALCGVAEGVTFTCPFPPWQPCCLPSPGPTEPSCFMGTEQECSDLGGLYVGGPRCDPVLCDATPLPCCQDDGSCSLLSLQACASAADIALGPNDSCDATACASAVGGACCAADQSVAIPCFLATPEACAFARGTYHGDGSTCTFTSEGVCGPFTGACCQPNADATQATCEVITFDACLAGGGIYQGDHVACGAGECDCCFPLRTCTTMPPGVCSDTLRGLPAIPTVSGWGALIMALLLASVGSAVIVRPRIRPAGS